MIKKEIGLLLGSMLLFNACTGQPKKEESAFIVLKTAGMKYADMGFIKDSGSKLEVEMYAAGQPLVSIEINGMNICMSTFKCMEKKYFNQKLLSQHYPDTLLENVFRAKPLFNSKNIEKNSDGFTQKIKKDELYDITYTVVSGERKFRDTINKILIKVREE
jgi:hypothetical protein